MKTFNYHSGVLRIIRTNIITALLGLVLDFIFIIYLSNNMPDQTISSIILFLLIVYLIYSIISIVCKYLISSNIVREKLEITDSGINITYHEKVLFSESLNYVELPWSTIKFASSIHKNFSRQNINFFNLFTNKDTYKTIEIYTANGLYRVFIEQYDEAVEIINANIDK